MTSDVADWLQWGFTASLGWAMLSDLIRLEIPDEVHAAIALLFGIAAFQAGIGWTEALLHVAAAAALFILGAGLFSLGIWGGGDAKLGAAIALWLGFPQLLPWILLVSLFGGVLALGLLVLRPLGRVEALPLPVRRFAAREGIPYGIALGAAGMVMAWRAVSLPHFPA